MLVPRLSSFPFHSSVQVGANDVNPEAFTTVILRGGSFLHSSYIIEVVRAISYFNFEICHSLLAILIVELVISSFG